jgi:hypothetical protein
MSNLDNKNLLRNIAIISIVGCLLSCCANVVINNFFYGSTVVQLKKNFNDYKDEEPISKTDMTDVNIYQAFKWNIVPAFCTCITFFLLMYLIIVRSATAKASTPVGIDS